MSPTVQEATSVPQPATFPGAPGPDVPIWAENVSKWYGPVIGVNELSLRVEGGIVALLGPNGAGKSTLIRLLTGQLRPSLGHIRIFGRSVRAPEARRRIGYCPDVDAFYEEMTGRNFVRAMLRFSGYTELEAAERAEHALSLVGMTDSESRRQAGKRLRGCSKGMRQRIKLAQALAHDPDLLILDEPLSGLDPVGRRDFFRLFISLAEQGRTLLISSHLLDEMEDLADSVCLLAQGRILTQGSWEEVAGYLEHLPQPVRVACPNVRRLARELIRWPGIIDVHFLSDEECIFTARDPRALCRELGRLVCEQEFPISRLVSHEDWAGTLFSLAAKA